MTVFTVRYLRVRPRVPPPTARLVPGPTRLTVLHLTTASPSTTFPPPGRTRSGPAITGRELAVLTLVVDGLTNPQIAVRLSNSPRTVQSHVRSLMQKFEVATRTELAVHALRRRVVPLEPADALGALELADTSSPAGRSASIAMPV